MQAWINSKKCVLFFQKFNKVEFEQKGKARAEYEERLLIKLSEDLFRKFGKGFSVDNLQLMRKFYITYKDKFQIYETPSRKSLKSESLSNKSIIHQTAPARFKLILS